MSSCSRPTPRRATPTRHSRPSWWCRCWHCPTGRRSRPRSRPGMDLRSWILLSQHPPPRLRKPAPAPEPAPELPGMPVKPDRSEVNAAAVVAWAATAAWRRLCSEEVADWPDLPAEEREFFTGLAALLVGNPGL